MPDTPQQQVAQREPCPSCSAALSAAVSMAKLVLRFEEATRGMARILVRVQCLSDLDMISPPFTEDEANKLAVLTQTLSTFPDGSWAPAHIPGDWDEVSAVGNEVNTDSVAEVANTAPGEPSATTFVADPAVNDHRWYAVTVGRAPGVYRGAYHLSGNSTGTPGGTVQRFADMHRALAAYQAAVLAGSVVEVTVNINRRVITPNDPVTIVDQ